MNSWLMLVSSAPGSNPAARMRIWRALKASGAGALRDGVHVLPRSETASAVFEEQAQVVASIGGSAQIVGFDSTGPAQEAELERSEEHTSELQSLMRISYAVFCLKQKNK